MAPEHIHRRQEVAREGTPQKAVPLSAPESPIVRDIKALNASILIISQKLQYIVRNEKILGRNLLVLNKKIKEIEGMVSQGGGASSEQYATLASKISSLEEQIAKNSQALQELSAELESVKATYAKASLVSEIKYLIDSINPLEFVTRKELEKLIDEKLNEEKEKKKK